MHVVREHLVTLLLKEGDLSTLGLSHSLSRYKPKFLPDKVDTMVSLLDIVKVNEYRQ
jgi:hypothetical protein